MTQAKSISLFCREGSSDKAYNASLQQQGGGWVVEFAYGPRGKALKTGTKTATPVDYATAVKIRQAGEGENRQGLHARRERRRLHQHRARGPRQRVRAAAADRDQRGAVRTADRRPRLRSSREARRGEPSAARERRRPRARHQPKDAVRRHPAGVDGGVPAAGTVPHRRRAHGRRRLRRLRSAGGGGRKPAPTPVRRALRAPGRSWKASASLLASTCSRSGPHAKASARRSIACALRTQRAWCSSTSPPDSMRAAAWPR